MDQDAPAFATQDEDGNPSVEGSLLSRYLVGIACGLVSLAILGAVCYFLESTKMQLIRQGMLRPAEQSSPKP